MGVSNLIDINVFSVIMLTILLISIISRKKHLSASSRFFIKLILSTIILLILESLSWIFDGEPTQYAFILIT